MSGWNFSGNNIYNIYNSSRKSLIVERGNMINEINYENPLLNNTDILLHLDGVGFLKYSPSDPSFPASQYLPLNGGGFNILIPDFNLGEGRIIVFY